MKTVGSFEAKTHLPALLRRVAKGEKILITRRGKPVAVLGPPEEEAVDIGKVVEEMLAWRDREGPTLGGTMTIKDLINEGRRY
jgi:prevent-host-death family protein